MPDFDQVDRAGEPVGGMEITVPVGISNRHVHVTVGDLDTLFGQGYQLTKIKDLSQPGEFAAQETVIIAGPKGAIEGVRILGPTRKKTQVEVSLTDSFKLGVKPPVRESGNLEDTPGIALIGPKGVVALKEGVILAARHIHMHPDEAAKYGLENGQTVRVEVPGERGIVFDNVLLRVSPKYATELHVDTDEANCALLKNGDRVKVLR
ncbi:phosphate propanoyltransferase [Zhaonella formicivorans]|jgi:putative phosphotransacetylase|uniref:phosphate propanoyltransferase n=1 Tax=Zhaonella formicivorans TaxID=2528593 RepID=UPI001D0FCD11|nr:phosphate propanoyltransferase [Zhaonella formicivorans]